MSANRYDRGEFEEALRALEQAAASVGTRTYLATTIEAVEHAFAAAGNVSFQERVALSIRIAGSQIPSFGTYSGMCRIQSALIYQFVERFKNEGEYLALSYVVEEAERLSSIDSGTDLQGLNW